MSTALTVAGSLVLPAGYGLVLMEAIAMGVQCYHEGMNAFNVRKKYFDKTFFSVAFPHIKPEPEVSPPLHLYTLIIPILPSLTHPSTSLSSFSARIPR
jgi:hypothetical protein